MGENDIGLQPWEVDEEKPVALTVSESTAMAAINRSEIETQLDAAHKYARSTVKFMRESIRMATISVSTAESCMYSVPRGGKPITGPSVRLAEIIASAYGNLHIGARVVDIGEKEVTAQGVAWDLETNLRVSVEVKRKITGKSGQRFNDDMINVTCAAACSIALRNAIFRVVPRAYVDQVYDKCRLVAVGDAKTFVVRRDEVIGRLGKMGATPDRMFSALGVRGLEDVTMEHLEQLIGMGTAAKNGERAMDDMFPAPIAAVPGVDQPGRKIDLKPKKGPVITRVEEDGTRTPVTVEREPGSDDT